MKAFIFFLLFTVPVFGEAPFRFADLEKIINEKQVTTVDELLPLLPEEYRKSYTFVYESRSSQQQNVSPLSPRVILYGGDARFIMAFTKKPNDATAEDTVETVEFDDAKSAFLFRGLSFKKGKNPLDPSPAINPQKCLVCHGSDPRPNWDTYNIWPGAYGSVSRINCDAMQPGTPELTNYLAFKAGNRLKDRYQYLPTEIVPTSVCPNKPDVELTFTNASVTDPNAGLTEAIFKLNIFRLKRIIRGAPTYPQFQYLWVGLGKRCADREKIEDFFPADYAKNHGLKAFPELLDEVIITARADFAERLKRFNLNNKGSTAEAARQPINFMDDKDVMGGSYGHRFSVTQIKLIADRMGLPMTRWSTIFQNGDLDFTTPNSYPEGLFYLWSNDPNYALSCDELKKKSIEALSG